TKTVARRIEKPNSVSLAPHCSDGKAARLRCARHCVRMLVIDIDDRGCTGRQQFLKQPQLGSEIRIEVRMIVEMIARDDDECARGKVQAIEPVLIEPMRRSF